jgi:hypothetical protein
MTKQVPADDIEKIVGVPRHPVVHWGKAVSKDQRVYILHSEHCVQQYADLRECPYSLALDQGIDLDDWEEDVEVVLTLDEYDDGISLLVPCWGQKP